MNDWYFLVREGGRGYGFVTYDICYHFHLCFTGIPPDVRIWCIVYDIDNPSGDLDL